MSSLCTKIIGFTLIELLVVVAIISILAAILFPVFVSVREKARQATCASNEKQLGLAFLQYTEDWDEAYPGDNSNGTNWGRGVYPYINNVGVFACPDETYSVPATTSALSYAFNENMGLPSIVHTSSISAPCQTVMVTELTGLWIQISIPNWGASITNGYNNPDSALVAGNLGDRAPQPGYIYSLRHKTGSNFLLTDGHVKFLRPEQVSSGIDTGVLDGVSSCQQDHEWQTCTQTNVGYAAGSEGMDNFVVTFGTT